MFEQVFTKVHTTNKEEPTIYIPDVCLELMKFSESNNILKEFCPVLSSLFSKLETRKNCNSSDIIEDIKTANYELNEVVKRINKNDNDSVFVNVIPKLIEIIHAFTDLINRVYSGETIVNEIQRLTTSFQTHP